MKKKTLHSVRSMISEARRAPKFWSSMSAFQFGEGLRRLMISEGMKQKDLAEKLGKSSAWISKVLNGTENLTLQKMGEIAFALGGAVHIHVARQDMFVDWSEITREADERMGDFEAELAKVSAMTPANLFEADTGFELLDVAHERSASNALPFINPSNTGEDRYGRQEIKDETEWRAIN